MEANRSVSPYVNLGIKEGFEYLVGLGQDRTIIKKFHGLDYSNEEFHPIAKPRCEELSFSTLGSFAEFCNLTNQGLERKDLIVHIESPHQVKLVGKPDPELRTREVFAVARFDEAQIFNFGKYMTAEEFIIKFQQSFDTVENARADILALIGNMTAERVVQSSDDGVSQTVGQKVGIALKSGGAPIRNPYTLCCYRTFSEVVQPVSPFILRVRQEGDGAIPSVALFESDNGAWKHRAMESIQAHLKAEVIDIPILA